MNTGTLAGEMQEAGWDANDVESRYQLLLASVTDYVYTVTVRDGKAAGTVHGPGCEAVTGYTSGDFAADSYLWLRMVYEEDRPMVLERAGRILCGEAPPALEHRIVRKDGRIRWIRNTTVPHRDESGRLLMYDGLVTDITERKQAEEQLRAAYAELKANQADLKRTLEELTASHEELQAAQLQLVQTARLEAVGTLAAGVAHDVRNMLQPIVMGVYYLDHSMPTADPNVAVVLAEMREAAQRAKDIMCEMLQVSGNADFERRDEDVSLVMGDSLKLLHNDLLSAGVVVDSRLAPGLPLVWIDRTKIEQVFLNLLINAVQAMPGGGRLSVTTREDHFNGGINVADSLCPRFELGERVVVAEIRDTGIGIPAWALPRIFDPYFTTKPRGVGTGLGLWNVKMLIDLHCGAVDVRNAPDCGVIATVILRVEKPAAPGVAAEGQPKEQGTPTEGHKGNEGGS